MAGMRINKPGTGLVQLSSGDVAYQLASVGSALLTDSGENRPQPVVKTQVTVSGVNPVLAWRSTIGAEVTVRGVIANGSSLTYEFRCTSGNPVGLIYWVFDVASASGAQMTGPRMQAWTEQGVKTFDSRAFAMKLSATGSGPNVAVIQSMFAYRMTNTRTNQFSNSQGGPWVRGDPGSNYTYYLNHYRGYHTAARFNADGTITTGLQQFETFSGGVPVNEPSEAEFASGQSNHTFIDISGLPSASMPSAGELAVGASHTLREVSVGGSGSVHSITAAVTVTPSGGTAPYDYQWERASGSSLVDSYGPDNTATFQTQANIPPGEVEAIWRCRVSDSAGRIGYSPDVVFRHTVNAVDLVPNPLTLMPITWATNEHYGSVSDVTNITGISHPIALRVERYNFSGNIDSAAVHVYSAPTADQWGPWTHVGSFDPRGTGLSYVDFTAQPNSRLHYVIDSITGSGRRDYGFDLVVWNMSSGPTVLSNNRITATVDADNNYNVVDITPDPLTQFGDVWAVTNEPTVWAGPAQQITGINQPITLRFERYGFSGALSAVAVHVYRDNGGGWVHQGSFDPRAGGLQYVDVTVNNGDSIHYAVQASTVAGRQDAAWNMVIWNLTQGTQLSSRTVTVSVDNDNNYYPVVDADPDPIGFANLNGGSLHQPYATANNGTYTLTGFDTPVTMRVCLGYWSHQFEQFSNGQIQPGDGPTSGYLNLDIYRNGVFQTSLVHYLYGSYSGPEQYAWADLAFSPNDTVRFDVTLSADLSNESSGITASTQGGIYFDRIGGARLGSFTHTMSINRQPTGGWGGGGEIIP